MTQSQSSGASSPHLTLIRSRQGRKRIKSRKSHWICLSYYTSNNVTRDDKMLPYCELLTQEPSSKTMSKTLAQLDILLDTGAHVSWIPSARARERKAVVTPCTDIVLTADQSRLREQLHCLYMTPGYLLEIGLFYFDIFRQLYPSQSQR